MPTLLPTRVALFRRLTPWPGRALRRLAAVVAPRSRRGSGREAPAAVGAVLALFAVEAGYRVYLYRQQLAEVTRRMEGTTPDSEDVLVRASVFDPHTGHRYRPNLRVDVPPKHPGLPPWRWQTNAHGHVSDDDYPVAKPGGEYRVVVIGDSFTAGVTNAVRWPAELEARLNADPVWAERVGGRRTRVINHGLDGIAAVQFPAVYEHDARRFEPDLVLVSLILDTLPRRPYYRGRYRDPARSADDTRAFVRDHVLAPLPWWGPTPEVLARAPVGRRLGLRPRLAPGLDSHYQDVDEGMAASLGALRELRRTHPRVVVLHHPMYDELAGTLSPRVYLDARDRLHRGAAADLGVVEVGKHPPFRTPSPDQARALYQMPHDPHPNDDGLRAYADAVRHVLVDGP